MMISKKMIDHVNDLAREGDWKARMPAKLKRNVENVVQSYGNVQENIASQVERTVKKLVAVEIRTLIEQVLYNILHCTYRYAQTEVHYAFCNFMDDITLDMLCQEIIDRTLNGHIFDYV